MNTIAQDIERYLNGEMTPGETTHFLEEIQQNQKAKLLLESYIEMNTIYDQSDWEFIDNKSTNKKVKAYEDFFVSDKGKRIADKIKQSEIDYFSKEPFLGFKNIYRYAAAIAAILVIGLLVVSQVTTSVDNEKLYAEYKDWSETLPSLTLRDSITKVSRVETLFRTQKYDESLLLIDEVFSDDSGAIDFQLLFYKGAIYLEMNNSSEALVVFNRILREDALDGTKAHWYLALSYLKENNINKAKNELQQLLNTTTFQNKNAQQLLKELQ